MRGHNNNHWYPISDLDLKDRVALALGSDLQEVTPLLTATCRHSVLRAGTVLFCQ